MENITAIRCSECGAPAQFDIEHQMYLCGYCGGKVTIHEALQQKKGFRKIRAERQKSSVRQKTLPSAACTVCGASTVFQKDEALTNCAFCGHSLVKGSYLDAEGLPESIIPFAVTEREARDLLCAWCRKNHKKTEARNLAELVPEMKGFYLPYELVRGPVHMKVSRMDGSRIYDCEGFVNDEYVNCSRQLDNLLLDGMEPFDTEKMTDFDFAYTAGHHIKIADISGKELETRIKDEVCALYTPAVRKTLETDAVEIRCDTADIMRYPVLLPVYYVSGGRTMAAVNGQTGKVSVRAEKESHYYFLPWWLKAIAATAVICGLLFGSFMMFGTKLSEAMFFTGILSFFFIIVTLCLYSDTTKNSFAVESGREIFTSGERTYRRERGGLVPSEVALKRKISAPVYFSKIGDKVQPVILRFTSPLRVARMIALSLLVLFLPVVFALILNGFRFSMLNLGGSAVWFCIFVPVIPICLLKFGVVELHNRPWIYCKTGDGKKKRYKGEKKTIRVDWYVVKDILAFVFIPPASLAVWFGIISFCVMVYLTAGFD